MSNNPRVNYPLTSPRYSAERAGLIKIDEILDILLTLLQKLDSDTGVSDTDYADLIAGVKSMKQLIGLNPNDFKIEE